MNEIQIAVILGFFTERIVFFLSHINEKVQMKYTVEKFLNLLSCVGQKSLTYWLAHNIQYF